MEVITRDRARIICAEHGTGFPVLALAPGGLRSTAAAWQKVVFDPVAELSDRFRVITMDQRNAGASAAAVTGLENWGTYAGDQLAVLDALGIPTAHLVGMCIGGAFILRLLRRAPERFARAVLFQPIGLADNREAFLELFDGWSAELAPRHPEAGPPQWRAYRDALYGGPHTLFSVPDEELDQITTPMLVLRGEDLYHPAAASELLAARAPNASLVERWKEPEYLPAARAAVLEFLLS